MVKYKTPENIPFKYNPFKKHPPKLGGSYSIMLGCWFGGMRMGLRRARCLCGYPGEYVTIYGVVSYMTVICMMWWGKRGVFFGWLVQ